MSRLVDLHTCLHCVDACRQVQHESGLAAWAPGPPPPGQELQSRLSTWAKHGSTAAAASDGGRCALGLGVGRSAGAADLAAVHRGWTRRSGQLGLPGSRQQRRLLPSLGSRAPSILPTLVALHTCRQRCPAAAAGHERRDAGVLAGGGAQSVGWLAARHAVVPVARRPAGPPVPSPAAHSGDGLPKPALFLHSSNS